MRSTTWMTLMLGGSLAAVPVTGQEHRHEHGATHPRVAFAVSCADHVRPAYERAVAMLHSFGYEEARLAFLEVANRDPHCGMAYWGVAMTYYHLLWAPPTPAELAAGREAAELAASLGAGTDRERAYIAAINAFYADAHRLDHRARSQGYREAMAKLTASHPDDDEASIFYALSILGAAPPSDKTYAAQKQAAAILNGQLSAHPDHPGIAHYTIHAFDYPELAELALPAARIYAELAPSSPHALHMPTHIFTRRGLWEESIAANVACRDVASEKMAHMHPGRTGFEALHCQDYLAYAYLQIGQEAKARRVVERVATAKQFDDPNFAVGYAMLAVPARFALERRDWKTAARLTIPEVDLEWQHFREGQGVTFFANAIGAARAGDANRAREALRQLQELETELAANPPAGPYDWAGQVESMRLAAAGWLAHAEGKPDEGVRLLTAAAEKERVVGKHPVTPGAILPARELLGDLLLELDRATEALAAYEGALADQPRRFNSLTGAARAARAAGKAETAARYYRALIELAAASRRPELSEARAFVEVSGAGLEP